MSLWFSLPSPTSQTHSPLRSTSPSPCRRGYWLLPQGGGSRHREALLRVSARGGLTPAEDRPRSGPGAALALDHSPCQPLPAASVVHPTLWVAVVRECLLPLPPSLPGRLSFPGVLSVTTQDPNSGCRRAGLPFQSPYWHFTAATFTPVDPGSQRALRGPVRSPCSLPCSPSSKWG